MTGTSLDWRLTRRKPETVGELVGEEAVFDSGGAIHGMLGDGDGFEARRSWELTGWQVARRARSWMRDDGGALARLGGAGSGGTAFGRSRHRGRFSMEAGRGAGREMLSA